MFQLLANTSTTPITFVNVGTVGTGVNPTAALPSGWATGDLLVIWGGSNNNFTSPAGWNISLNYTATSPRALFAWKIATSGETNVSITNSGGSTSVVMGAWRNVSGLDTNGTVGTGISTSNTTNTLVTTVDNSIVISAFSNNQNTSTYTGTPASTTVRLNFDGTATSSRPLLLVDEIKTTAGTTTARTATIGSSQSWTTFASSFKQA